MWHYHSDNTKAQMTGVARPTKLTRYMRCVDKDCESLGRDRAGQTLRTIHIEGLEAAIILWGLFLLEDPDQLNIWSEAYDRQVLGEHGSDAHMLAAAMTEVEVQKRRIDEMARALGEGLLTFEQPREYKQDADTLPADAEGRVERMQFAQNRVGALRIGVAELKDGNMAAWLAAIREVEVRIPTPAEVDPREPSEWMAVGPEGDEWEIPEAGSWDWIKSSLRSEAKTILASTDAEPGSKLARIYGNPKPSLRCAALAGHHNPLGLGRTVELPGTMCFCVCWVLLSGNRCD